MFLPGNYLLGARVLWSLEAWLFSFVRVILDELNKHRDQLMERIFKTSRTSCRVTQ